MKEIPLNNSFAVLMFPFRLPENWIDHNRAFGAESLWQHSNLSLKDNYLFEHVATFFNRNVQDLILKGDEIDKYQSVIFELKNGFSSTWLNARLDELFTQDLLLLKQEETFKFRFFKGIKKSILSPKVFVLPQSNVGLLLLSVQLLDNLTLEQVINFQYASRTLYRNEKQSSKIFFNKPVNESRQRLLNHLNLNTEKNINNKFITFYNLTRALIKDFVGTEVYPIHLNRFHIFSFVQVYDKIQEIELKEYLFQLIRVYNHKYRSSYKTLVDMKEIVQPFQDIYMGASPEGGCIFINSNFNESPKFLQQYGVNPVQSRYVWTYLLAFQQRCALINTAERIDTVLKKESVTSSELANTIDVLSRIQIKSMFEEISPIFNHNLFYTLCREQFNIASMFGELKNELTDLNLINQQKVELIRQEQYAKQQKLNEIRNKIEKTEKERHVKFENRFNFLLLIIGVLTFISVWKDLTDIRLDGIDSLESTSLWILSGSVLLLGFLFNAYKKRIK